MKILITFLVVPLVVLAALVVAVYQLIASIPAWLLAAVIGYLLYRLWRRSPRRYPARYDSDGRAAHRIREAWATPVAAPAPPQTVVYVVAPDRRAVPNRNDAPEPWILH
ncbi:MAG: hypothetical protein K2X52_15065 [Mycobacteriaceae bacterium]|nr:hypothetical protein [Mycobacteriaceae bacterium]